MECDICLIEFDSNVHIPRILPCGHTFCENCLISIYNKNTKIKRPFVCPTCQAKQNFYNVTNITNLAKNYNLLSICEKLASSQKELRITSLGDRPFKVEDSQNDINFQKEIKKIQKGRTIPEFKNEYSIKGNDNDSLNSNEIISNFQFDFDNGNNCPKHGLPIHSYAIGTTKLLCDQCIKETRLQIYRLPGVLREIKRKADQNVAKICLMRNEILKLKEFLLNYVINFENEGRSKIEKTFNYFYKIIKYFENDALQVLTQCVSKQKTQINKYIKEMETLETELTKIEKELLTVNNCSDEEEIFGSINSIKTIERKLSSFINYNMEMNLISMDIGIEEKEKSNLLEMIQKSYRLKAEFLKIKNKQLTVGLILCKEDNKWNCICGQIGNLDVDFKCPNCGLFRRFETVKNVYTLPQNINYNISIGQYKELENFYNQRRKAEIEHFQKLIKEPSTNGRYYAIDVDWFLLWKCYVTNDKSEKNVKNNKKKFFYIPKGEDNTESFIFPPESVDNNYLCEYGKPRKGLVKNKDYMIINDKIWDFFSMNYNGGPEVELNNNNDLYKNFVRVSQMRYISYTQFKRKCA